MVYCVQMYIQVTWLMYYKQHNIKYKPVTIDYLWGRIINNLNLFPQNNFLGVASRWFFSAQRANKPVGGKKT